jgi:hypothetical protein
MVAAAIPPIAEPISRAAAEIALLIHLHRYEFVCEKLHSELLTTDTETIRRACLAFGPALHRLIEQHLATEFEAGVCPDQPIPDGLHEGWIAAAVREAVAAAKCP